MRIKVEDTHKFKVKRSRKCSICGKKIKFFINEHDTFDELDEMESIKIWKDKDAMVYCGECYSNPRCPECWEYTKKISENKYLCIECNFTITGVEDQKQMLVLDNNDPREDDL